MRWIAFVLVLCTTVLVQAGDLPVMKIGALLDEDEQVASGALMDTLVARINADHKILPRFRLHVVRVKVTNSFAAAKATCALIDDGCVALIGPTQHESHRMAQEIAARLQVPFFARGRPGASVGMTGASPAGRDNSGPSSSCSTCFDLLPPSRALSRAFADILKAKKWKNYALIYEKNQDLVELAELIKNKNILLYQYQRGERGTKRLIREIGSDPQYNYIVQLPADRANDFFRLAGIVGLLSEYFSYFVTAQDFHTWQLPAEALSNITALQLLHQEFVSLPSDSNGKRQRGGPKQQQFIHQHQASQQQQFQQQQQAQQQLQTPPAPLKYHTALLHDYIFVFARAVGTLSRTQNMAPVSDASCHKPRNGWPMGLTIATQIKASPPFVMWRQQQNSAKSERNGDLEGFCIDLLNELSRMLQLKFDIRLVNDSQHGSRDRQGNWNGLIKDILDMEADVALADLTVNVERARVVSFTTPFLPSQLELLYRPPSTAGDLVSLVKELFSPLSQEVWLSGVACVFMATFAMSYASKFSPRDRVRRSSSKQANIQTWTKPRFSFGDIFHLVACCALRQPPISKRPRGVATRFLTSVLCFTSFVFWSVYTARLTAQFVQRRMHFDELHDAGDLLRVKGIRFGYVANTSSQLFLQGANYEPFSTIWSLIMGAGDISTLPSLEEGLRLVQAGGYAMFTETPAAEYHQCSISDCSVLRLATGIETPGYALALPRASPYTELFSQSVQKLREKEVISRLQRKWFLTPHSLVGAPHPFCRSEIYRWGQLTAPGFATGPFILLGAGALVAALLALIECCCIANARRKRSRKQSSNSVANKKPKGQITSITPIMCSPDSAHQQTCEPKPLPRDGPDDNTQIVAAVTTLLAVPSATGPIPPMPPAPSEDNIEMMRQCRTLDLHALPNILPPATMDLYNNINTMPISATTAESVILTGGVPATR
ncbi:glutamate receptor ionotropic, kainate 1-like isoform X3 [Varroa jacobsoni]|uniref:glutamate receptor ionotropic, kainate 1-like isoform X3 n=1 Tax=Varroa jacobsoni TaxID=62625 RepID=UPI000BF4C382|nr:glutamate receptor ionotropic, kainate 1-like isoform X3 [Varroa jacobsoni]